MSPQVEHEETSFVDIKKQAEVRNIVNSLSWHLLARLIFIYRTASYLPNKQQKMTRKWQHLITASPSCVLWHWATSCFQFSSLTITILQFGKTLSRALWRWTNEITSFAKNNNNSLGSWYVASKSSTTQSLELSFIFCFIWDMGHKILCCMIMAITIKYYIRSTI